LFIIYVKMGYGYGWLLFTISTISTIYIAIAIVLGFICLFCSEYTNNHLSV